MNQDFNLQLKWWTVFRKIWLMPIFVLLIAFFFAAMAAGQDENAKPDDQTEKVEKIEDPKAAPAAPAKVDIAPEASDDEIGRRLSSILDASKRFESPRVTVDDGVVFLEGVAKEDEFKLWATDLANKTQDVAAVVNRMTLPEQSIWDFSEAWDELGSFQANAVQAIPLIIFGFIVLLLTWLLARGARHFARHFFKRSIPNELLRWVAAQAIMLPIIIFGIYLVLRISGLTQLALTVLGGTGLIGLVIGIAFQDIAENFLASVLISVQSPFRRGDLIRIEEHEGIVQRVSTRGTTLMTPDGNLVQIPNSHIYKSTILNFTANPDRRLSFDLGIGYDDPVSEAQEIVLEKVKQHVATLNEPPPKVLIETLGASTVNLRIFFWVDGSKTESASVRSSVMRIAKQALQKRGISMPDEAREVIFPNGVPVDMQKSNGQSEDAPQQTRSLATTSPTGQLEAQKSADVISHPEEMAESEAEGNMRSETDHLKRQAKRSWLPGEGSEILIGDSDEGHPDEANSPKG
ncbi:mechanosensitive ion channel family protein [Mariniblastus sp.]|nr:mechanosensitive ion channel family protein [Mariniblastus sp.]